MASVSKKQISLLITLLFNQTLSQGAGSLTRGLTLAPLPNEISVQQFANDVSNFGANVLAITVKPQSGCDGDVLTAPPNTFWVTGAEVLSASDSLQSKIREGLKMFEAGKPGVVVYYFCSNTKSFPKKLIAGKLGFQLTKQKRRLATVEGKNVAYQTRILGNSEGADVDSMVMQALG
jgi:hypothetical protein